MSRVLRCVELEHTLFMPHGRAPTTRPRQWSFDVPAERDSTAQWEELLHRIFFDANVRLRQREPGDVNWLGLVSFRVSAVDEAAMFAWDGTATAEAARRHLPWILAAQAVTWEDAANFFVDATGRYDGMSGNDFSELIAWRALKEGRVTEAAARDFAKKLYPRGDPEAVFADRVARLANIEQVRATHHFRKPPSTRPFVSGPVPAMG
jgi:hypothetical protein